MIRSVRSLSFCVFLLASVSAALADTAASRTVKVGGSGVALGSMQILAAAYRIDDPSFKLVVVPGLGANGGLKALNAGAIDLAIIGRPIKVEESAQGLSAVEIGRTPFVLVTNMKEIPGVRSNELAEIFNGKTTRWPDGTPIRLILRPLSDSDTVQLAAMSPQLKDAVKAAHTREGMIIAPSDQDGASQAERQPGSLATSTLALVLSEKRSLKVLPLDGVTPSTTTISDRSYRHVKSAHLVAKTAASAAVTDFIRFVHSPQGRAILEKNGFLVGS